jgi:hypothetical protein
MVGRVVVDKQARILNQEPEALVEPAFSYRKGLMATESHTLTS